MIAAAIRAGIRRVVIDLAENLKLVFETLQRLQGAAPGEIGAGAIGPPLGRDGAVREVDERCTERCTRSCLGKTSALSALSHQLSQAQRFKEWQCHARGCATKECSATERHMAFGSGLLICH